MPSPSLTHTEPLAGQCINGNDLVIFLSRPTVSFPSLSFPSSLPLGLVVPVAVDFCDAVSGR